MHILSTALAQAAEKWNEAATVLEWDETTRGAEEERSAMLTSRPKRTRLHITFEEDLQHIIE